MVILEVYLLIIFDFYLIYSPFKIQSFVDQALVHMKDDVKCKSGDLKISSTGWDEALVLLSF